MSCQHGNPVDDCELCSEIDGAWDRGAASRDAEVQRLQMALAATEPKP